MANFLIVLTFNFQHLIVKSPIQLQHISLGISYETNLVLD